MKLSRHTWILVVALAIPFSAGADGIPEEEYEKYAAEGHEVQANDYPPTPDPVEKCDFVYCEKPSAEELSTLTGLIQLEEQRAKYLELKAKRLETQSKLEGASNGITSGSEIPGLYVSRIFTRDGVPTAQIYYQDRYFFKSNNQKLSSSIAVHKVLPFSVVFNIGGTITEVGLTPQAYIDEAHESRVSEAQPNPLQPSMLAMPLELGDEAR